MVSKFPFTPPLKTNYYSQLTVPSLVIFVSKHLVHSYFYSFPSQQQKLSLSQSSLLHWRCAPPKLSPPLKLYFPEAFSSIKVLLSQNSLIHWRSELSSWRHDSWCLKVCVWGFDVWKSGFVWVWEWFHGESFWYLKIWVFFGFGNGFTKRRFNV